MVVGTAIIISERTSFPGFAAIAPVMGTVLMLVARGPSSLLGSAPLQRLGKLSYSWYLWHWPALVFGGILFPDWSLGARAACALGSLLLAQIAFALVENPIRFNRYLLARPATSVMSGLALTVFGMMIGLTAAVEARHALHTPAQRKFAAARADLPDVKKAGCMHSDEAARPHACSLGDKNADKTIVLFGDSHAAQWSPALADIALQQHWNVVTLLAAGCPAVDVSVFLTHHFKQCDEWRRAALRQIEELRPDAVIASMTQNYVRNGTLSNWANPYAAYEEGHRKLFARMATDGIPLILIRDTPTPSSDVPICLSRKAHNHWFRGLRCDSDWANAFDSAASRAQDHALRDARSARLVDLTDQFCDGMTCTAIRNGHIVYRDDSHITASYAKMLAPVLASRIVPIIASGNGVDRRPTTAEPFRLH